MQKLIIFSKISRLEHYFNMATRKFGTCFFEQYAQISLSALLGSEFDCLLNMDRPDLQSPDGKSIGIEVTRAMEESKQAEMALLKDVAGITKGEDRHDIDQILEYGYSFGLQGGKYIGLKDDSRLIRYRITQEQRQTFYHEAIELQKQQ